MHLSSGMLLHMLRDLYVPEAQQAAKKTKPNQTETKKQTKEALLPFQPTKP